MNFNIFIDNLTTTSDLYACRVCLATDIKLFDIHECDLAENFEAVMGLHVPPDDGLPQHLCHYCFMLLQKYSSFRDKCSRSQTILHTAVLLNQSITTEYLRLIDRDAENLALPLAIQDTGFIDYEIIENEVESDQDNLEDTEYLEEQTTEVDTKDDIIISFKEEATETKEDSQDAQYHQNDDKAVDDGQITVTESNEQGVFTLEHDYVAQDSGLIQLDPGSIVIGVPKAGASTQPKKAISVLEHPDIEVVTLTREEQLAELEVRRSSGSYLSSLHKCHQCCRGFLNVSTYRNHMVLHNPANGDIECEVCEMRFPTSAKLRLHEATAHEKSYRCRRCDHVSHTSHRALDHQRWHEGSTFDCKYCGESFQKAAACMQHVRAEHAQQFACTECPDTFLTQRQLSIHVSRRHPHNKKKPREKTWLYCGVCSAEFRGIDAFNMHMSTASNHTGLGDDMHKFCNQCGDSFRSDEELRKHADVHVGKRVKCPQCDVKCSNYEELSVHCAQHEMGGAGAGARAGAGGDNDTDHLFVCEICGRKLSSSLKLLIHRRTHMLDKPYVCPFCQKPFKFPQYLQIHVRTHTGERPYVCHLCDMSFLAKANLNRHFKVHTGDKPYVCDLCGKAFTQSNSLKLHVRTVHLKMPDPYRDRRKFYRSKHRADANRTDTHRSDTHHTDTRHSDTHCTDISTADVLFTN